MTDLPPPEMGYERHVRVLHQTLADLVEGPGEPLRPPATAEDIDRGEELLGRALPQALRDFYAAVDGCAAYGHIIEPVTGLGRLHQFLLKIMEPALRTGELASSLAQPVKLPGDVIALSGADTLFLLYVATGPAAGTVWEFDRFEDVFRPVAPSLERLLACWAAVAQTGLVTPTEIHGVDNYDVLGTMLEVIENEDDVIDVRIADVLRRFECTPTAINVYPG